MSASTTDKKPDAAVVSVTETVKLAKYDGDGPDAKLIETIELLYEDGELVKRKEGSDGTDRREPGQSGESDN